MMSRRHLLLSGLLVAGQSLTALAQNGAHRLTPAQRIAPPVSAIQREVDRLVAITKPGYYSRQANAFLKAARAPSDCAGACIRGSAPLLVTLISFTGERLDATQVNLNWSTSSEINNDHFAIERSANPAAGFEAIGTVVGQGTTSSTARYSFIDPNTSTGYTYYRLKPVERDGTVSYSSIIAIKGYTEVLGVKAFPNPGFHRDLSFLVSGVRSGESLSVSVFDARGVVIYQNPNYVLGANQQIFLSGFSTLRAGSYYVQIKTSQQQASTTFIVVP
ncbi:T9SS type A sorting domain-containing protein [Spirosoma validum]|uniref:T9SS type A sorting domain-containing protein n=1 Tax=Spirosoma validum TaxID=2771355 RepID=A0A927AYI7_9BACT|nr:T9SS type A sorting domain-containing protein [Spirosoma validum]MBD2752012.1 T9SS type A sorting domain-containing protein [Spirosoma validum]